MGSLDGEGGDGGCGAGAEGGQLRAVRDEAACVEGALRVPVRDKLVDLRSKDLWTLQCRRNKLQKKLKKLEQGEEQEALDDI